MAACMRGCFVHRVSSFFYKHSSVLFLERVLRALIETLHFLRHVFAYVVKPRLLAI
jgi:hypothetical protein